jgi:hypothetical protein
MRKIAAFLLVALWLPTTQHCMLAAADLLALEAVHAENAKCCAEPDQGCTAAMCTLLESGSYKPGITSVTAPIPSFTACACLLCLHAEELLIEADAVADTARVSFDRPPDCSPTWQFVQRAALSPRAPSVAVA